MTRVTSLVTRWSRLRRRRLLDCSSVDVENFRRGKKTSPASIAATGVAGRRLVGEDVESNRVRNVGIVAHIDAGKTTTTERLLYYSGLTRHIGDIDEGDTVTDFMDQERERGITITSAAVSYSWKDHRVNLIDTPGHVDFTLEVEKSLRVLDGAILVLDASAGVEAQTMTVWRQASRRSTPCIVFVNKMDKTNADLEMTLDSIRRKFNVTPLLMQVPIGRSKSFRGVVDLLSMTKMEWKLGEKNDRDDGAQFNLSQLSSDDLPAAMRLRQKMAEGLADVDDDFADAFLSCENSLHLRPFALKAALRRATLASAVLPVFLGAAARNVAVQPLMNAVNDYLPAPSDVDHDFLRHYSGRQVCALAFKIGHDVNKGPLTFVRVYAGRIVAKTSLFNVNEAMTEKNLKIYVPFADEFVEVPSIEAGGIGVIAGLRHTKAGDTLTDSQATATNIANKMATGYKELGKSSAETTALNRLNERSSPQNNWSHEERMEDGWEIRTNEEKTDTSEKKKSRPAASLLAALPSITIPEPVFFCTIEPPSLKAIKDMEFALERLQREDPSLRVKTDEDTGETVLSGMGELHLEIILERIRREYKVDASLGNVKVAYKEALSEEALSVVKDYVFDRIMKGRRRYVEVTLEVSPAKFSSLFRSHEFWNQRKSSEIPTFVVERQVEQVREGVIAALQSGPLLGHPFDHDSITVSLLRLEAMKGVPRTAIAAAAANCLKTALAGMRCQLLEPVMDVEVSVDSDYANAVLADLNSRRAFVHSQSREGDISVLKAKVPLAEMLGYAKKVRTVSSGTATYFMSLSEFRSVDEEETTRMVDRAKLRGW